MIDDRMQRLIELQLRVSAPLEKPFGSQALEHGSTAQRQKRGRQACSSDARGRGAHNARPLGRRVHVLPARPQCLPAARHKSSSRRRCCCIGRHRKCTAMCMRDQNSRHSAQRGRKGHAYLPVSLAAQRAWHAHCVPPTCCRRPHSEHCRPCLPCESALAAVRATGQATSHPDACASGSHTRKAPGPDAPTHNVPLIQHARTHTQPARRAQRLFCPNDRRPPERNPHHVHVAPQLPRQPARATGERGCNAPQRSCADRLTRQHCKAQAVPTRFCW